MTQSNEPLETLSEIRSLMERSSRFISLSGLSGVFAGTVALLGAALTFVYLGIVPFQHPEFLYGTEPEVPKWGLSYWQFFWLIAAAVFAIALAGAIYFTTRKARRKGLPVWDKMSRRLLINLAIPLIMGGIFIIALTRYGLAGLVAPTTLIFYGLALLNASKYTLNDIRYLGVSQLVLGAISLFNLGYGLEFWAIGFGILHIVYGIVMYRKYERADR